MKLQNITEAAGTIEQIQHPYYLHIEEAAGHAKFNITNGKDSQGHIFLKRIRIQNHHTNKKDPIWIITLIEAKNKIPQTATPYNIINQKYGPLLYDIAIEYSTLKGKGLIPAEALTQILNIMINPTQNIEQAKANGQYYTKQKFTPYNSRNQPPQTTFINKTSQDARKIYQRIYQTQQGLTGPINHQNLTPYINPTTTGFNAKYLEQLYNVTLEQLKTTLIHKTTEPTPEIEKYFQEAKKDGWNGDGWPTTTKMAQTHAQEWIKQNPSLSVIYTKPPTALTKLKEQGKVK